jgi:hypothetical protein
MMAATSQPHGQTPGTHADDPVMFPPSGPHRSTASTC